MKSEKAKEILNTGSYQPDGMCPFSVPVCDAANSVEVAEQELMDKSLKANILSCDKLYEGICYSDRVLKSCDGDCYHVKRFKEYMK